MNIDKLYTLIDEIIKKIDKKKYKTEVLSDSEIILIYIVSCFYFNGNYAKTIYFMSSTNLIKYGISRSRYSRRLNRLRDKIIIIFKLISDIKKNESEYFQIDSFPVKVCHNIRIITNKILKDKVYRGRNESKREYYYGYKVQIITSNTGYVIEVKFMPGSFHDSEAFSFMDFDLPENSNIYADSAYTNYYIEKELKEYLGINFLPLRKKNSKREDNNVEYNKEKQIKRRKIETFISCIDRLLPKKIHATNYKGFILKVFGFIVSYNINLFLK